MSDLLKELESQHNIRIGDQKIEEVDDEYEESYINNDQQEMQSELDNFDKKIKVQKDTMKLYNGDSNEEDSDSDQGGMPQKKQLFGGGGGYGGGSQDDNDYEEILRMARLKQQQQMQQQQPQKKVLFGSNTTEKPPQYKPANIEKIQQNIMTQQKVKVQQSEEYQLSELLNNGTDSQKDKKLRELITRNRNLQVQYEREKALKIKMENQLNQMIKDNEDILRQKEKQFGITSSNNQEKQTRTQRSRSGHKNLLTNSQVPSEAQSDLQSQADIDWQKRYQQVDKKLQEFRVNNQNLKNELNKAHRVISREIGENFSIDKVLSEENSWKGRAQMIEKLKGKVRDLQQKLGMATNTSGFSDMTLGGMSTMGGGLGKLDKTAAERRKEIESLKQQNQKLQEDSELITSKFKAMQSRKNNLEIELKDLKGEYEKNKKILMQKSNADDQYIKALKQEYEKLKRQKGEARVIYKNDCEHEHKPASQLQQDQIKMKNELKLLQSELDTKEAMIQELIEEKLQQDEKISQYKNNGLQPLQQPQQTNNIQQNSSGDNDVLMKKLQQEVKVLKLERQELFQTKISDKESRTIIKDLSMQNAKLRGKIDDLQQQIKK